MSQKISRMKHASCIASASAEPSLASQRGSELINTRPHHLIRPEANKHLTQLPMLALRPPFAFVSTAFFSVMFACLTSRWCPPCQPATIQPRARRRLDARSTVRGESRSNLNACTPSDSINLTLCLIYRPPWMRLTPLMRL